MRHHRDFNAALVVAAILALITVAYAANEITVTTYLRVNNGAFDQQKNVANLKIDQLGRSMTAQIQNIGTSEWEVVVIGTDVSTNGVGFFRNISTNTDRWVEIGTRAVFTNADATAITNYVGFMRIRASEPALMRLDPTNAIYARAYGTNSIDLTAGVNLEYFINED